MSAVATKVDRRKVDREYRTAFNSGPPPILQLMIQNGGDEEDAWRACEKAIETGVNPVRPVPHGVDA